MKKTIALTRIYIAGGLIVSALLIGSCAPKNSSGQVCFGEQCVYVEIARNAEEMTRGLQSRPFLPKNQGMLFIFPKNDIHRFWMKDTLIPLDIIWLGEDKKIVDIAQNAQPCQALPCPVYSSGEPSVYVLEINGGQAETLGLNPADQAVFKLKK